MTSRTVYMITLSGIAIAAIVVIVSVQMRVGAADKAAIQLVRIQPCQLPVSDM